MTELFHSVRRNFVPTAVASFLVFAFAYGTANAGYSVKNLDVNDQGGASYVRDLTVSSSGSFVFVRSFVSPDASSQRKQRVGISNLPSGLVPVSYSVTDSDCSSISNASIWSTGFSYEFPGDCDGIVVAKYRTSGMAVGSHAFSATVTDCWIDGTCGTSDDSTTATNSASVTVSTKAVLIRAKTFDVDGDGFLDAYDFFFNLTPAAPLSSPSVNVYVGSRQATGLSYPSALSMTGRLAFNDSTFAGWELPRVDIAGNSFYETGSYYVGVVEDGAAPVVTPSKPTGTYTWALSVSLASSESGSLRYSYGTWTANASSTAYTWALALGSNVVLSTFVTDLAGNSRQTDFAYSFACPWTAPANGHFAAFPTCSVVCDAGYTMAAWVCIATGGGSSGGSSSGGSSGGSSGWSSGGSSGWSSGGSSGWSSGGSSSGDVTGSYGDPSTISRTNADSLFFTSLSWALAYLDSRVSDTNLKKTYATASKKLIVPDFAYFKALDAAFAKEYNRALNAFVLYYVNVAKSKTVILTADEKADSKWSAETLSGAYAWARNPEKRYVEVSNYWPLSVPIYRTKLTVIASPLQKFEKKYVGKFDLLLRTATISESVYRTAMEGWNGFVLHLTVYRQFWANQASKDRALAAIKKFEPVYKKRARTYLSDSQATTTDTASPVTVQETFPKDLVFWETSEDVRKLQSMMRDAGYFGTLTPTGYFWPATKSALVKFSSEILRVNDPEGTFSWSVRAAANAYAKTK